MNTMAFSGPSLSQKRRHRLEQGRGDDGMETKRQRRDDPLQSIFGRQSWSWDNISSADEASPPTTQALETQIDLIDLTQDSDDEGTSSGRRGQLSTDSPDSGAAASAFIESIDLTSESPSADSPRIDWPAALDDDDMSGLDDDLEVCFGLVEIPAMALAEFRSSNWIPVEVEPSNNYLAISNLESQQRLATANNPLASSVCDVARKFRVTLRGKLVYHHADLVSQHKRVPATLRAVIYGFMTENDGVGRMLSDDGVFLQNPSIEECENDMPYHNPQYLLRPGGLMPSLEDRVVESSGRNGRTTGYSMSLSDVERHKLLQLFESSHDPEADYGIRPSARLRSVLKSHQVAALAMMVEKECGSTDEARFPGLWEKGRNAQGQIVFRHVVMNRIRHRQPIPIRGGILADDMGLGKTLSAIALVCWHLDSLEHLEADRKSRRPTLIVTPKSLLAEWEEQLTMHVKPEHIKFVRYHGSRRLEVTRTWYEKDVILTTYDTVRSEAAKRGALFGTRWARIILDESHNIRNRKSKLFQAVDNLQAICRWCLTGTPIQNSLEDFGSLLSFIQAPGFEYEYDFNTWILKPIADKKKNAFTRLRQLVRATCLRRTKESAGLSLPAKTFVQELVELDPSTRELYEYFKQRAASAALELEASGDDPGKRKRGFGWGGRNMSAILPLIHNLRRICDHGEAMLSEKTRRAWRERDVKWLDWELMQRVTVHQCEICGADIAAEPSDSPAISELGCGHVVCQQCLVADAADEVESDTPATPTPTPTPQACPRCSGRSPAPMPTPTPTTPQQGPRRDLDFKPSEKLRALIRNLHTERQANPPAKSVIFSYWTTMLDFIEKALRQEGIGFRRIDGSKSIEARVSAVGAVRNDPRCQVLLATIGSAGEGLNLTCACRVHLMEPHWNPMAEQQAIDRVHRIMQTRDVVVTRYLVKNSIEFFVREVQEEKLRLIHQSLSTADSTSSNPPESQRTKQNLQLLEYLK